eukprot:139037-Pelagomonas_calceolata.AAC.2
MFKRYLLQPPAVLSVLNGTANKFNGWQHLLYKKPSPFDVPSVVQPMQYSSHKTKFPANWPCSLTASRRTSGLNLFTLHIVLWILERKGEDCIAVPAYVGGLAEASGKGLAWEAQQGFRGKRPPRPNALWPERSIPVKRPHA